MLRLGGVRRVVFYILVGEQGFPLHPHPDPGQASQRDIWIWERLKVSKVRGRHREMFCAESQKRTIFIRELIWKEIGCEIAG